MSKVLEAEATRASAADLAEIGRIESILAQGPNYIVGPNGERAEIPDTIRRLLTTIVQEFAVGNGVTVASVERELTTQQASNLLSISRPALVSLLESGAIPFYRVGTHRRVKLADVLAYRNTRSQQRRTVLAEMAREAQELGLYE
jgi:excisionase family DNA binding protein